MYLQVIDNTIYKWFVTITAGSAFWHKNGLQSY